MKWSIEHNVRMIHEEIAAICAACGRNDRHVQLVAVSKNQSVNSIREAQQAGILIFGENRMQELMSKYNELGHKMRWHFIGHLQTNKINHALQIAEMIHSIDSVHLAEAVSKRTHQHQETAEVLLQVNTGGEASKYGFSPEMLQDACYKISQLPGLKVRGLMTMAPFTNEIKILSGCFSRLRLLSEQIAQLKLARFQLSYLSMGMSNDYKVALKEGSNMLRIGSAIFGPRN
jgi:pyridoxal phosphate enzyme (YggS family)